MLPTWLNRKSGIDVSESSIHIVDQTAEYQEMTIQELTALVRNSVVRIETDLGSGSGFIIDSNGLILTNNHVISDAEEIKVFLEDDTEYTGEILARDPLHDLAVITIEASGLVALEIGEYEEVELGQQVVVLGYPLGNDNVSVTSGLVSAIEYDEGTNVTYIQTDSAVNPGNSGGPMVNMNGQVIGIVAAKLVGEAIEGIGYAISIMTINTYLPDLLD
jgi:serine protease Do